MAIDTSATDTVLAVDFGSATTRVMLFDIVESTYRLVGYAEAPTTVEPPYKEASEGMRHALLELQAVTGRTLLDDGARVIMPATSDGRGADRFVATASAGPAVRTLLVGLLPDVSLASARHAAAGNYLNVVDTFSLADARSEDQQIDAVLRARPDMVLIAGGTDGGASQALLQLVENIGLAMHLLTNGRPRVLFMGNAALQERIEELVGRLALVRTAPNVQPQLGHEHLGPARAEVGRLYEELRLEQVGGYAPLAEAAGGRIVPTASASGLFARFLSKLPTWPRGVLLVDVGASNTTMAAAWNGYLFLSALPDLGVGAAAASRLPAGSLGAITRWVPAAVGDDALLEFALNKRAHPHTVPAARADLLLEHALARHAIRTALSLARPHWPEEAPGPRTDLLPWFSLIVGAGAVLARAPRPGLAALLLLDGLQPSGVTRLMLDPYHLTAALGALAHTHPVAAAQVYDSGALVELGTAASIIGPVRVDTIVCEAELVNGSGQAAQVEVRSGTLAVLPLAPGEIGKLTLRPRPGYNAGFGPGRTRTIAVRGGAVGAVIDARGRPIAFPRSAEARLAAAQQWIATLEGQ